MTNTATVVLVGMSRDDLREELQKIASVLLAGIAAAVPPPVPLEREYSRTETAKELLISLRVLDRLKRERKIGFYRKGGRVTFGEHHIRECRERFDHPATSTSPSKPRLVRRSA